MHIPDRIIIVGGLPRTGKTLLRNTLGSHSQIAFTPTALNFFYWFSNKSFTERGGFQENLEFFLRNTWIAEKWDIKDEETNNSGKSRRELFLAILDIFRTKFYPDRNYVGTYIHLSEEYFHTLIDWFGFERLRFLQIIRNPYENYSSYIKNRKISKELRKSNRYNSFVNLFCNMWGQSAVMGINRALKHPNTCRVLYFEELLRRPEETILSICDWIGVDRESDRMLEMVDFPRRQNSAFIDTDNKEFKGTPISQDTIDRIKFLTDYEIETIRSTACTDILNAMDYHREPVIINFKFYPESIKNQKVLSKLHSVTKSYLAPLPYRTTFFIFLFQIIQINAVVKIISMIKVGIKYLIRRFFRYIH